MRRHARDLLAHAVLAVLVISATPAAASQTYRSTGSAAVTVDGVERHFVAFEVSDADGTAATATWSTGGWIGDWWWIDLVFVEADVAELGWEADGVPMLSVSFFVDPASGAVAADVLRAPDVLFTENSVVFWPFHESLPGAVEVAIDSATLDGDAMRVRGRVTAVLGLVVDMEADEPDPSATIVVRAEFDLTEVVRLPD